MTMALNSSENSWRVVADTNIGNEGCQNLVVFAGWFSRVPSSARNIAVSSSSLHQRQWVVSLVAIADAISSCFRYGSSNIEPICCNIIAQSMFLYIRSIMDPYASRSSHHDRMFTSILPPPSARVWICMSIYEQINKNFYMRNAFDFLMQWNSLLIV